MPGADGLSRKRFVCWSIVVSHGCFPLSQKIPNFGGNINEFSDRKELFHLIVNSAKMAAELITIGTGFKYDKRVNGSRNSVWNVPTGKKGLPF